MKFNLKTQKDKTATTFEITDMESVFGVELVINERERNNLPRYYVYFENSETIDGSFLIGTYGNGQTMDEAIENYAKELQGKIIVFNAWTKNRKEFIVPNLKHTKLLNK